MPLRVCVLTHFPSPYQVELFNAIAVDNRVDLSLIYLREWSRGRQWSPVKAAHSTFSCLSRIAAPRYSSFWRAIWRFSTTTSIPGSPAF